MKNEEVDPDVVLFSFKADAEFYAYDLRDAFLLMARHFLKLALDMDYGNPESPFSGGSVSIGAKGEVGEKEGG